MKIESIVVNHLNMRRAADRMKNPQQQQQQISIQFRVVCTTYEVCIITDYYYFILFCFHSHFLDIYKLCVSSSAADVFVFFVMFILNHPSIGWFTWRTTAQHKKVKWISFVFFFVYQNNNKLSKPIAFHRWVFLGNEI